MTAPQARGERYRRVEYSPLVIGVTLAALALTTWIALGAQGAARHTAPWLAPALYAVVVLAGLCYFRMTLVVDNLFVRIVFGLGLPRRSVPLAEIAATEVRRMRFAGVGIRWTRAGWLYNVGGREAVCLALHRDRAVIIGSRDAQALRAAVDRARGGDSANTGDHPG